jgi:hypothetical protein
LNPENHAGQAIHEARAASLSRMLSRSLTGGVKSWA